MRVLSAQPSLPANQPTDSPKVPQPKTASKQPGWATPVVSMPSPPKSECPLPGPVAARTLAGPGLGEVEQALVLIELRLRALSAGNSRAEDAVAALRENLQLAIDDEAGQKALLEDVDPSLAEAFAIYRSDLLQQLSKASTVPSHITRSFMAEAVVKAGGSGVVLAGWLGQQLQTEQEALQAFIAEGLVVARMAHDKKLNASLSVAALRLAEIASVQPVLAQIAAMPLVCSEHDVSVDASDPESAAIEQRSLRPIRVGAQNLAQVVDWLIDGCVGGRLHEAHIGAHGAPGRMIAPDNSELFGYPLKLGDLAQFLRLAPYMSPNSVLILGGCRVGLGADGANLLASLALALGCVTQASANRQFSVGFPKSLWIPKTGQQGELIRCAPGGSQGVCSPSAINE